MIPWRREWQPTPVFLPGEVHGQRSLEGYCLWGRKELDTTEQLTSLHFLDILYLFLHGGLRGGEPRLCVAHMKAEGKHVIIYKQKVFAAAAAKSPQSCLTLCDPIDGSPPGSPVPGILQARTLE